MLLTETVMVKWNSKIKKYYQEKGYIFTKMNDEFEVRVDDLTLGSNIKVSVKCDCDDCKNPCLKPIKWIDYMKCVKEDGKYYCQKCSNILFGGVKRKAIKLKNNKSFAEWCYENLSNYEADEILSRWDYDLNYCKPSEIYYFTVEKFWFKCPCNRHKSEFKSIDNFITIFNKYKKSNVLKCNQCNSFAQWGIDNICEDFLDKYWDYDKNVNINPCEISYGKDNLKVWIKCQEDNHESYYASCHSFIQGSRCPVCNQSKGEIRINNYLINKINFISQKEFEGLLGLGGKNLSYDFCIPRYNLLIEYQGEQHDHPVDFKNKGKKYAQKQFEKQLEHDRRKKEYANNNNIKLLEIWYWDYDNIETILDKELYVK